MSVKLDHLNQARAISHYRLGLAILFLSMVISPACQPAAPTIPESTATPFNIAQRELRRQQQKWQDSGISHYSFRLFRGCLCEGNENVLVEVENGQIVLLEYQSGKTMPSWDRTEFEAWGTMERLFSAVEEERNRDSLKVTVRYDPTYGFPVEISSERSAGSDDELYLTISEFEMLP